MTNSSTSQSIKSEGLEGHLFADHVIFAAKGSPAGRQHLLDWLGGQHLLLPGYVHVPAGAVDLRLFGRADCGVGHLVASAQRRLSFPISLVPERGHLLVHGGGVALDEFRVAFRSPIFPRLQGYGTTRPAGGIFCAPDADLRRRLLPFMSRWRRLQGRYRRHLAGYLSWSCLLYTSDAADEEDSVG